MYEVEAGCKTEIVTKDAFEIEASCGTTLEAYNKFEVDAQLKRWTVCSDNIYLLKFYEKPPGWLEDIINEIVDNTGLADDVSDLEDRFSNFEEGYTEHFYDWKDGDTETLAYVSNIYTTNTAFSAGIQEIKVAYVSKDESGAYWDQYMGAWQTGAGGAWFNERVSTVSNVAYAAAKSASTLTAVMQSQQDQLEFIAGDLDDLAKQVDGVVETWFGEWTIVSPQGDLDITAEPYATWLAEGSRDIHTGDSYVQFETDVNGNDIYIASWRFALTEVNEPYTDAQGYAWVAVSDSRAEEAYQLALDAKITADGKINTYYLPYPPTPADAPSGSTIGSGDIWIDSDDKNTMYRYDGTDPFVTSGWKLVRDTDITASVNRLDEATVDINGIATAKSSLVVNADGNISGFVANASNDPDYAGSDFRIFADNFYLAGTEGQPANTVPFQVDTTTNNIKFNGYVEFSNVNGAENVLLDGEAAADINKNTTTIDGGKITTYSIDANRMEADTIWVKGMMTSYNLRDRTTGYIGNDNPAGFLLNASIGGSASYNYPTIYGAYIRGGEMYATHLEAVVIDAGTLNAATINAGTINAGIINSTSINGMSVKMGSFVTTHDGNYTIDINLYEGRMYDENGTLVKQLIKTAGFEGLVSVLISSIGPSNVPTTSPAPAVIGPNAFVWDRDDTYSGTQVFSYVAWGY